MKNSLLLAACVPLLIPIIAVANTKVNPPPAPFMLFHFYPAEPDQKPIDMQLQMTPGLFPPGMPCGGFRIPDVVELVIPCQPGVKPHDQE